MSLKVEVANGHIGIGERTPAIFVTAFILLRLRVIVVAIVGEFNGATTRTSWWVPACGDIGGRAKGRVIENAVVASGTVAGTGSRRDSTAPIDSHRKA